MTPKSPAPGNVERAAPREHLFEEKRIVREWLETLPDYPDKTVLFECFTLTINELAHLYVLHATTPSAVTLPPGEYLMCSDGTIKDAQTFHVLGKLPVTYTGVRMPRAAPTPSEDATAEAQEFLDSYGLSNIPRTSWDDDLTKAFSAMLASAEARGIERAAKVVPTNWLDEILTGENSIGPAPYTNRQVEDLLRRVQDRIRALVRP